MAVAMDANFRLKRRAVSNSARDPALGSGWGYFVEDTGYKEHIMRHATQDDVRLVSWRVVLTLTVKQISTCTGFQAMMHANTKHKGGYATTGVVMCICARHGVILPNGVGDLQKGER